MLQTWTVAPKSYHIHQFWKQKLCGVLVTFQFVNLKAISSVDSYSTRFALQEFQVILYSSHLCFFRNRHPHLQWPFFHNCNRSFFLISVIVVVAKLLDSEKFFLVSSTKFQRILVLILLNIVNFTNHLQNFSLALEFLFNKQVFLHLFRRKIPSGRSSSYNHSIQEAIWV